LLGAPAQAQTGGDGVQQQRQQQGQRQEREQQRLHAQLRGGWPLWPARR
jgi:hypothetical protein